MTIEMTPELRKALRNLAISTGVLAVELVGFTIYDLHHELKTIKTKTYEMLKRDNDELESFLSEEDHQRFQQKFRETLADYAIYGGTTEYKYEMIRREILQEIIGESLKNK